MYIKFLCRTHRHPESAVPSSCSLNKDIHLNFFEQEGWDDIAFGQASKELFGRLLLKAPQDIEDTKLPCTHVLYNDLIADSIGTVRAIYATNGWEFTQVYEDILKAYLEGNKRDREKMTKKGQALHTYTAEDFGLSNEELSQGPFETYVNRFHIPKDRKK